MADDQKPIDDLAALIRAGKIPSLIRRSQVDQLVKYSNSELYRRIKAGTFPAPLPKEPGERASYWLLSEVLKHVEERIKRHAVVSEAKPTQRTTRGRFARPNQSKHVQSGAVNSE